MTDRIESNTLMDIIQLITMKITEHTRFLSLLVDVLESKGADKIVTFVGITEITSHIQYFNKTYNTLNIPHSIHNNPIEVLRISTISSYYHNGTIAIKIKIPFSGKKQTLLKLFPVPIKRGEEMRLISNIKPYIHHDKRK